MCIVCAGAAQVRDFLNAKDARKYDRQRLHKIYKLSIFSNFRNEKFKSGINVKGKTRRKTILFWSLAVLILLGATTIEVLIGSECLKDIDIWIDM